MRRALVLVAVAAFVSGCRLQLGLDVELARDGAGDVAVVLAVDDDALARVGGDVAAVLEVDDLEADGWEVSEPSTDPDGFTRVRVEHAFTTPEEANAILADVSSTVGPFVGLEVWRDVELARTSWGFDGRLDFAGGLEALGDSELAAELDGLPLGQSPEDIEAELGAPLEEMVTVVVDVALPGDVTSNATAPDESGGRWEAPFGAPPVDMDATGEAWRTATLVGAGVAAVGALGLVIWLLVRLRRRRRREPTPVGRHAADPSP